MGHIGRWGFSHSTFRVGKTTMANLVAKIMVKMKLIKTDKVVQIQMFL